MVVKLSETVWGICLCGDELAIAEVCLKIGGYKAREIIRIPQFLKIDASTLEREYDLGGGSPRTIVLSVPFCMTILRTIPFTGDIAEVKSALQQQIESVFSFKNEELYFDLYPIKGPNSGQAILAGVLREELDDLVARLRSMGLEPGRIIIEPIALSYSPLSEGEPTMVVGGDSSKFWYTRIQSGEILEAGLLDGPEELLEVIGGKDERCLFVRGGAQKDMDVEWSGVLRKMDCENADMIQEAIGAGLWFVQHPDNRFDLLGREPVRSRQEIMLRLLVPLVLVLFLLGLYLDVEKIERNLQRVEAAIAQTAPNVEKIREAEEEIEAFQRQVEIVKEIEQRHVPRLEILEELSRLLPPSAWLRQLSINEDRLEMAGEAKSATDIVSILDRSPLIDKVKFMAPVVESESGGELFRIEASIVVPRGDQKARGRSDG